MVATAFDGSGNVLTGLAVGWSSDDEDVATVDANGLVTAVAFGTALVTAEVDGTNGVASVRAQEPVTGSWTGGFDWPDVGGSCGLTLSLTEDATGAFTGTGTLTGPACVTISVTFDGTNSAHVVTATLSAVGPPDVPFSGSFDGKTEITGAFSGSIVSTNFLLTRTSSTPTPPSAAAQEGTSGTYSTYASPGR
ncbi:MAG: Ig-like domain-containing protein [Gemmatimonadetes bacterium]|nr:Ig-like domain-containing protein [Gemmatimonadota bacterium]